MKVEVVRAWPRRFQRMSLELAEGATLGQAVAAAGFDGDAEAVGYAVFGVRAGADTVLREGDRVELLRPLQVDPKDARRRRAEERPLKKK
ncbi:RnfH family protein [Lysobacter enzymogenes]|uniref:RnfH family protein n=1 Tax=Lysobacter enzymogenes TaxID=69 RepID=UPI001AFB517A|nr:RnfH family protein [Lysobacter enzymogenes]QQP99269.1 RnfH family protein [Lysobacter enzymogenes]